MSAVPKVFGLALSLATFILVIVVAQVSKLFSSDLQFRFMVYVWALPSWVRFMV